MHTATAFSIPVSPYAKSLGISRDRVEADLAVYSMPFRAENVTIGDVVHGGAIASLADVAATAAAWSTVADPLAHRGTTIDLSISYIAAARATDLVAHARVLKRGGSICFVEVDVRGSADGILIARAKAVYKLSPAR
jgi:uncharacterized protein (TIGR00369 family)